jgi:hypothetical protein
MADVMNGVELDQDYIRKITGPFTWEGIFTRIEPCTDRLWKIGED